MSRPRPAQSAPSQPPPRKVAVLPAGSDRATDASGYVPLAFVLKNAVILSSLAAEEWRRVGVAMTDGEIHEEERSRIKEYFTKSWGFHPSFIELGINWVEENMSEFEINDLSRTLAELADDGPDCNYTKMTSRIAEFLQELIEADGKIHEEEERALDEIRQIFNDRSLVNRVTNVPWGRIPGGNFGPGQRGRDGPAAGLRCR